MREKRNCEGNSCCESVKIMACSLGGRLRALLLNIYFQLSLGFLGVTREGNENVE